MFRKLFSRRESPVVVNPPYDLDEHYVSLTMLHLLLADTPTFRRDDLVAIVQTQFGHIDFKKWSSLDDFYAAWCAANPDSSEGFRAMSVVAYLVLGTDVTVETVKGVLETAFSVSGVRDLPEFVEAESRFQSIPLQ